MSSPAASPATPANRLAPVDGLRAVAVLGVIWWHTWIHTGTPALTIAGGLNLQRLLVPLGTGFQLFFVLSGFCLYLSYQRLRDLTLWQAYGRFLQRRWWRLTPAFYFVCLITAAALWIPLRHFSGLTVFGHTIWLFGWIPGCEVLSSVFWTLEVEWEFYLLLPLLFSGAGHRMRFGWLGGLMLASLVWRVWIVHGTPDGVATFGAGHLAAQFMPFAWGILAAECWLHYPALLKKIPALLCALLGVVLAYLGRGLESTEAFYFAAPWGWLPKAFSTPVMTLGFALILLSTLVEGNRWLGWLSLPFFQLTGRLSYGLYLWHWWPSFWTGTWIRQQLGDTVPAHYLTLAATLAICFPLAALSYRYLEKPFLSGSPGVARIRRAT